MHVKTTTLSCLPFSVKLPHISYSSSVPCTSNDCHALTFANCFYLYSTKSLSFLVQLTTSLLPYSKTTSSTHPTYPRPPYSLPFQFPYIPFLPFPPASQAITHFSIATSCYKTFLLTPFLAPFQYTFLPSPPPVPFTLHPLLSILTQTPLSIGSNGQRHFFFFFYSILNFSSASIGASQWIPPPLPSKKKEKKKGKTGVDVCPPDILLASVTFTSSTAMHFPA